MLQRFAALVLFALIFTPGTGTTANSADRPNILLVAVDDMGYSDIGPFGSEIKTPSINALAEEGLKFTNFMLGRAVQRRVRCCFPEMTATLPVWAQ